MTKTAIQFVAAILVGFWIAPCHGQEKPAVAPQYLVSLHQQLTKCWTVPRGTKDGLSVRVIIKLKPDGMLDGEPEILGEGKDELSRSAVQAVAKCQPFKAPKSSYEAWKQLDITFAPVRPIETEWKSVSLKCPVGNEPLEYIMENDWGKARYLVWYKGNAAIRTAAAIARGKDGDFGNEETIDLLHPRNEEQRKRGSRQLEIATEQKKLGCLGKPADRKKYFEQLKSNVQNLAPRP